MSILGSLKSAFWGDGGRSFNEDDVRIEPFRGDKKVAHNQNAAPADAGEVRAQPKAVRKPEPAKRKSEPAKAKADRMEPAAETGSLRYLSPAKDAFMDEVSDVVGIMVNMADVIDQNYELMSDDERREVVAAVRSMRMFLKHGKSLQASSEMTP